MSKPACGTSACGEREAASAGREAVLKAELAESEGAHVAIAGLLHPQLLSVLELF